jgi:hypothetical protein
MEFRGPRKIESPHDSIQATFGHHVSSNRNEGTVTHLKRSLQMLVIFLGLGLLAPAASDLILSIEDVSPDTQIANPLEQTCSIRLHRTAPRRPVLRLKQNVLSFREIGKPLTLPPNSLPRIGGQELLRLLTVQRK